MRLVRGSRGHPGVADAVTVVEAMVEAEAMAAARVASEEATRGDRKRCNATLQRFKGATFRTHQTKNWAGLDSNQRRRKASRFTVCPVWPLRYLPVSVSVDIGAQGAARK